MSAIQAPELVLDGCSPVPLAVYLKALGVLRLLGEQRPEWQVCGSWREDRFVLKSTAFTGDTEVDHEKVQAFFLNDYQPTSIVAPWNGGSGFYPSDNIEAIDAIADGDASRFEDYRAVISFCRGLTKHFGLNESPKDQIKAEFLSAMRAMAPEGLLSWIDAAVMLAGTEPRYPPLLGTGGNDGRLDFTNNFMQRVVELFAVDTGVSTDSARELLPAALFGSVAPGLMNVAVGQFNPGSAGGPNAGAGFEGEAIVNSWDFVLMLEGALFFAAAVTRRLEASEPGMLAYPFTVRPSGAGNGSMGSGDEGQGRAEIWLPLWRGFSSAREIRALLTEGRATLGRRAVRDGLGFVRAIAGLGVDRGIESFQRYGFLMRSGKAYLATPLTRVHVLRNPDADLIDELESGQFLDRLRRFARDDQAPVRIRSEVHQLEDALFELAQRSEPRTVQKVITFLGSLIASLDKSRKGREAVPVPPPLLSENWAMKSDDGSAEFRVAAALAGLDGEALPMRPFIYRVKREQYGWVWQSESRTAVWGEGNFAANIGEVIARRRLEGNKTMSDASTFQARAGVSSGDVAMWLSGHLDESRLSELFLGLVNIRIPQHLTDRCPTVVLPAAYNVIKPFFTPTTLLVEFRLIPPDQPMSLPGELLARLQAGRVQDAVNWAWRRLRAIGYRLPTFPRSAPLAGDLAEGQRMLAALAMPLVRSDLKCNLGAINHKPLR